MNKITTLPLVVVLVATMGALCAADTVTATIGPAGQKLDCGLGELPHCSHWRQRDGGPARQIAQYK